MKRLILLSLLALGCKKDTPAPFENAVIYTVHCESCTAIFDTRNGLKWVDVTGFYQLGEMNSLQFIAIRITGHGEIKSSIRVNDNYVHRATGSGSFKINLR